jgi:RimJ/RimL family protein N-acetyltransferase
VKYLYGHDDLVADFVAALIPSCRERGFGRAKAIGVMDNAGRLIAGIVYHNYDPDAELIEISGAALPKTYWLTRETLRRMYEYPFLQVGVQMIVQRNAADDEYLLGVLARYGYAFIRIPRMLGRDRDGVLCTLTYEDWIANKFNRGLTPLEVHDGLPTKRAA